jgi:hypothetical protein
LGGVRACAHWYDNDVPVVKAPAGALGRRVLFLGCAGFPVDGLLIDVRVGARVLDQVVAEGGDVVADEFQDSLAGRDALLEEVDDP